MAEMKNEQILHQVYLEQYKTNEVVACLSLLEDANRKIKEEILKSNGVYTKKRYSEISKALTETSKKLRNLIDGKINNIEIIEEEIEAQRKIIATNIKGTDIKLDFVLPNVEKIKKTVQFKPFLENANYSVFLDSIQSGFYNTWDNAVRTGYLAGLTTKKIIADVIGVTKDGVIVNTGTINSLRNSVERNTRTFLQSVANETRNEFFSENEKYFSGYQYLATLDRRSCLVCGELDGKIYEKIEDAPQLPQHYNCRCILSPIVKGLEEIGVGLRASENGYVEDTVTFDEWLSEQSPEVQKEVLGTTRYGMYQKTHKLGQFVADGKMLTLEELRKK